VLYGAFFACYPLNFIVVIGENFQLVKEARYGLFYALYDDFLHIFKGTTSAASSAFTGQLGEAGNSLCDGFRAHDNPFIPLSMTLIVE
jgi:hypothetical protein